MYYVYVLRSLKDNKLYIGWTPNLKARLVKHQNGKVLATKGRRPFKLIYYEGFISKSDSLKGERYLKRGWGRRQLGIILKSSLD